MSSKVCQHCGCSEIDIDQARGDAVCTNCGSVLEDNIIVSEVQFEENARGGTSSIGQFVSLDGKVSRRLNDGLHVGGQESRLVTLENGRKKIVEVAQQLRLNQHCIDTAFNFFKMAVHRRLTRGRRHCNVIAACLYIVCRIEATPHMLLDFCDVLQVNVYELGKTYLRLSTALCINIPAIDPCLYIVRFAHRLQFGDKTHEVSMTALRLVQRMKRDWMHTGRRPAGLCGAALLVAARLHEFNRTIGDIIKVVKVCTATLRKRLIEFGDTPSSRLTLDEFMTIDLEEEQDPPAFKAARMKARIQQLDDQNKVQEATTEISKLQGEIERILAEKKHKQKGFTDDLEYEKSLESEEVARFVEDETIDAIAAFIRNTDNGRENEHDGNTDTSSVTPNSLPHEIDSIDWVAPLRGLPPTAASLGLTDSIEECMAIKNTPSEQESGELDLTGIDDSELDGYIMSAEEVKRKTDVWHRINAEYLKEQKEKEEREAKEKEENANKPEKKKRKTRKKNPIQANSAGEAIEKMLQEKRISNKINYDVLRSLNASFESPASLSSRTRASVKSAPIAPNVLEVVIEDSSVPRDTRPKSAASRKRTRESDDVTDVASEQAKEVKLVDDDDVTVVVENGPPQPYEEDANEIEEELYEEEEEDEGASLTAQLLRQHRGDDDGEYEDVDDYYD